MKQDWQQEIVAEMKKKTNQKLKLYVASRINGCKVKFSIITVQNDKNTLKKSLA